MGRIFALHFFIAGNFAILTLLMIFFVFIFSVFFVALAALFMVFLFYAVVWSHLKGAPFVPSRKAHVRTMIALAEIKQGETIYDLGSGDGVMLCESARLGAKAVGIEINPFLVWYSRIRAKRARLSAIFVTRADFRTILLHDADVVFLYLWPSTNASLREKLLRELKPGSRIISNAFIIEGMELETQKNDVYLYIV